MKHGSDEQQAKEQDKAIRDIAVWTRRYAQNRTLSTVAWLVIWLVGVTVLYVLGTGYDRARAGDSRLLVAGSVVLICAVMTVMVWFRFVSGERITQRIAEVLYGREGSASMGSLQLLKERIPQSAYFLFGFCMFTTIGLILAGSLPYEYWASVSATFFVPFLVYAYLKFRDVTSPFMLLWPGLYALHALVSLSGLFVIGKPFSLAPKWQLFDMLIPLLGYSIVAGVAGHIYSRIALRRLRALAAGVETMEEAEEAAR